MAARKKAGAIKSVVFTSDRDAFLVERAARLRDVSFSSWAAAHLLAAAKRETIDAVIDAEVDRAPRRTTSVR